MVYVRYSREFTRSRALSETGFGSNGHLSAFAALCVIRNEESYGRSYLITMDTTGSPSTARSPSSVNHILPKTNDSLETSLYRVVHNNSCILYHLGMDQTDGGTDGQTDKLTIATAR